MNTRHDAVVIGGGPAGATAAILLARAGWSVAIVEAADFPRRKVCGEFLSATSLPLVEDLGLGEIFEEMAGPHVRRVAVFGRHEVVTAEMPAALHPRHAWGRALGREHLDTALLQLAAAEGAAVWQPWRVVHTDEPASRGSEIRCSLASRHKRSFAELRAPVVIAAHGSWECGSLATQPKPVRSRRSDLIGFKAHFRECRLPTGLMPLITFRGGYGGLVHSDHGRVSLSCCVRRDVLEDCRRRYPGSPGEALLAHMKASCEPLDDVLSGSRLDDRWRAAGPIRPGIRATRRGRIFLAGNAAGEAHPVVAEGISMAMQSGWLLATHLIDGTGDEYAADWRRLCQPRIVAASLIAHWAMRPGTVAFALPFLRAFPTALTIGARTTGKVMLWNSRGSLITSGNRTMA
jgi:flavin-dependent dehydrogenase